MRAIKFRAWDKKKKQMVEVRELTFLVDDGTPMAVLAWEPDAKEKSTAYLITLAPGTFELMQFTGLHDKNGKEIYEGDVVEFIDQRVQDGEHWKVQQEVKWEHGSFYPNTGIEESEVIGNIYENPESLAG